MNTYTKLKDETWGVRVQGTATAGQSVTVTKKDGSTKTETIKSVLWTGADKTTGKTISLCSVQQFSVARKSSDTKTCWECGCEFTYADAKHNDGDWQDSYCGC